MALKNKKEVEIFYKTHNLSLNEVAKHFNISYRTLAHWAKEGGWVKAEAIANIAPLESSVVNKNANKVLDMAQVRLKNQIRQNLGDSAAEIDRVILDNLLQTSTDEILLKAMSLNFIQKNIALCAVVAKSHLLNLVNNTSNYKESPIVIACAEKTAKIFSDMKYQLYGKDNQNPSDLGDDYTNLSDEQLEMLLKDMEE